MSNDFVHLHVHSEYSLLDGLGRIQNLVAEAKRLGQRYLALTDHGTMHGAVEFFRACRAVDITPIIGVEAYQTVWGRPMGGRDGQSDRENYHLLLLAKNMTGYRNLLKIASHSQTEGYYYKPRIDHEFLAKHAEGLVASTGCLGAEVPQLLMQGKEREAYERLGWYIDVFGRENFYIELQEHSIPELIQVNKILVPWAKKFDIQFIATNDVHYVREEDGSPHDVLLCVQTSSTIHDEKRMRMSDGSYFLKSRAQMEETFRPLIDLPPSAFDNTIKVAEMCEVDLEDPEYHLPDLPIPINETYETHLRKLTEAGLARLYGERATDPEIQERKERELRIIHQMGFDVYFLIVADLCDFARSRNIWWNVRGSGAGSLVAYCIGITGIDPLKNNLIFERFLNPGRVTMPDFDLDYPDDQREEMIRYTVEKYGEDQVAQIVTFGRMKARAAIRDVGRAKAIPLPDVDRIAKLIPGLAGKKVTIKNVLTEGNEFYSQELRELYDRQEWVRDLLDTSMQLEGVARHAGIHAAAVIVADRELEHYTPLMRASKSSVTSTIAQYEFPILESIGLLKVDFLGLSTLSVMREAGRLIRERHGIEYDLSNIPFEGEDAREAFTLLSSGEVSGVFQVESQGMRRVLTEMQPSAFEHIIATISLYRPGPLEYIPQFIRRMHGDEKVEYKHPALEPILNETYGIIVYQEQIIQVLSQLAGYTPGEADLVRRAISKKKEKEIDRHRQIFIDGCGKNGIPAQTAKAIYDDIEFFARYGFNKSHAADYAVITVQTAYLKAHYPVEYMAALLLIERDKTDKVVNFINECRRMGIDVLPPDINYSGLDFVIQERPADTPSMAVRDPHIGYDFPVPEGSAIRFGMAAIKNVGEGPVNVILAAREEGGPFTSLEDLCDRVDLRQVNKRALESLIKAGALDRFGKRSQLLAVLDQMMAHSAGIHSARASGQMSIFDLLGESTPMEAPPIELPDIDEVKGRERLQWEKELLGVYTMSHPLQHLSIDVEQIVTCACNELDERYDGKNVTMIGMIADVRTITTKKGDPMAFMHIEDLKGQCEVVVFPKTYAQYKDKLELDSVVLIKGQAQTRNGQTNLLADTIQTYVEQAINTGEEVNEYQQKLFDGGPTINGVAVTIQPESNGAANGSTPTPPTEPAARNGSATNQGTSEGKNGMNGIDGDGIDERDALPTGEKNPFRGSPPDWAMESQAGPERPPDSEERKSAQPASEPSPDAAKPEAPTPPVAAPVMVAETAATEYAVASADELNLSPASVDEEAVESAAETTVTEAPQPEVPPEPASKPSRRRPQRLTIAFRRSGDIDRDIFRLKELYERVRDPRGRDRFRVRLESKGKPVTLDFPSDYCTINERLTNELTRSFRVEISVEEG